VHVEIWSDIACPWCYVGKRRFEAALADYEHRDEVTVTWRSFELDPTAPAVRDEDAATHIAKKYGTTPEKAREMQRGLTETAAADGLDFRLDLAKLGNTFDAHRLVHLGASLGIQDQVEERFMRAYQVEGEAIGERETLERLAIDAGLPADEVRDVLLTERYAEDVRDDERTAEQLGVRGVPFFVVDRAVAVSGAQPPEVLRQLLEQARPAPAVAVVAEGDTCGPDGC